MHSIILQANVVFMTLSALGFINDLWKRVTDAFPGLKATPSIDIPSLLLFLLVALFAAWLLSRLMARLFAGPLDKVSKIRGGNLENTAGTEASDDVGQLFSRVFNTLAKNLKTTSSSIETLHKEIAGHKLAEDTLKRAKTDLEKAYRQLQEAFEVEKTRVAQAQSATTAQSQFIANVSHEIRTPLTGIIGICDLLLATKMSKEQMEYAQIINFSADALLNIINSTLDLSKIEAGKIELENIDFNLSDVVEDVIGVLAVKAAQKDLELIDSIEPDVPLNLKGDPGRLRQILVNLIGNAIKFTSTGDIFVKVTLVVDNEACSGFRVQGSRGNEQILNTERRTPNTEHSAAPSVILRFAVRDTGIGILDVKKDQLFNMFTQADASIARNFGGTGLGLAIAKGFVKQMGGTIGVESEHGKGSTFWFVIPLLKQKPESAQVADPDICFEGARILVVDDNETSRAVLARQLQSWRTEVKTAADGKEALALLRSAAKSNNPFTAAIIDLGLPGMDGFALGEVIKADSLIAKTALLLLRPMILRKEVYDKYKHLFATMPLKPIRRAYLYNNLLAVLKGENISAPDESGTGECPEPEQTPPANRLHVLVAEDNMANQKVALTILEKMGHSANAVANGREVLDALATIGYDLVLMDIQMPEMDGLEATAIIRDPKSPVLNHNIPVLALTAHVMEGDREKCLAAGMNGYIAKPVTMKAIANAIAAIPFSGGDVARQGAIIHKSDPDTVFDSKTFSARVIGDRAPIRDVINTYLSETQGLIRELEQAVKNRHQEDSVQLAHNIKGGAATVSGNQLRSLALKMQTECEAANWPEADALLPQLNGQFDILGQAMREYLQKAEGT
ncbi:MAG: response regulator [Verrucomicrobiota bacterium]